MAKIISYLDEYELEKGAADIISQFLKKLLLDQGAVVFSIPGGRSVTGIFEQLGKKNVSWEKIHIFMVDERLVPLNHPQSNFKLARERFIDKLLSRGDLPRRNVHPFIMDQSKPDFGTSDYGQELERLGGCHDLVLLSSGEDSHVAALFPEHHSILDESPSYIVFHDSPKPPRGRMSISPRLLMKSRIAVLLFKGEAKRAAYAKFQDERLTPRLCPAKLVLSVEDSYILTDLT